MKRSRSGHPQIRQTSQIRFRNPGHLCNLRHLRMLSSPFRVFHAFVAAVSVPEYSPETEIYGHEDTNADETEPWFLHPIRFVSFMLSWQLLNQSGRPCDRPPC
jgi:hypothetical protein